MIKIAPVGTCRIHTPLRRAALHYPFKLDLRRNYGFVHTSTEVLQQLDLILGGPPVPQALWPLIYRPNSSLASLTGDVADPDFFFIEISSTKLVTVHDVPIQMNYVNRYFHEFFSNRKNARQFWSLSDEADADERREWLGSHAKFLKLSGEGQELLSSIRMRHLSAEEVEADMKQIAERVGKDKCLFITHVDALAPDGTPVVSRKKLVATVKTAAENLSLRYYDPTAHMEAFGQVNAMERDGLDLTHFTLPFYDFLGGYWFETYLQDIDGGVEPGLIDQVKSHQDEVAHLRDLLDQGHLIEVSQTLQEISRNGEPTEHHHRLLAKLCFSLGDYAQVRSTLKRIDAESGMNEEDDIVLISAYMAEQSYEDALAFGKSLIANERENDAILIICADAAQALGQDADAIFYLQTLLGLGSNSEKAQHSLLNLLLKASEFEDATKTAEEILEDRPDDQDALRALWHIALTLRSPAELQSLLASAMHLDPQDLVSFVKSSDNAGYPAVSAALLQIRPERLSAPTQEAAVANALREIWVLKGNNALECGDIFEAAKYLGAAIKITPKPSAANALARQLRDRFRTETREAFADKDYSRVLKLAPLAEDHEIDFSGFDKIVGRAAAELEEYKVALPYFRSVAEKDHSAASLLKLARIAAKAEDYGLTFRSCNTVVHDIDASAAEKSAAQKLMKSMFSRAIRKVRDASDNGRIDEAWELLKFLALDGSHTDRIATERARVVRQARRDFKALDSADTAVRSAYANLILKLDPTDASVRRAAAKTAMLLQNFAEARAHWQILAQQVEMTPQIEAAMERCTLWIERLKQRKAA